MAKPVPSIADLSARARAALPSGAVGLHLSPVLPADWPPSRAEVEWFAYQSTPLPTGVGAYEVAGPTHKVSVTLPDGAFRVAAVVDGRELGREGDTAAPGLEAAEQALVELVMARRAPDTARTALEPYARLARRSPVIGPDLTRRKQDFFRWLGASKP